jgi:hypothetical protein
MKGVPACFVVLLMCSTPAHAQESSRSLERISIALQQPSSFVIAPPPLERGFPKKLGPFTLVQPTLPGEVFRLSIPVGELVVKAVTGVTKAHRRRQEAAIRRRIDAELKWLRQQAP